MKSCPAVIKKFENSGIREFGNYIPEFSNSRIYIILFFSLEACNRYAVKA